MVVFPLRLIWIHPLSPNFHLDWSRKWTNFHLNPAQYVWVGRDYHVPKWGLHMVVHIFIGLHYCCDLRGLHGLIYFYSSERISYLKVLMHELKFRTSLRNIVVCLIIKVWIYNSQRVNCGKWKLPQGYNKNVVTLTGLWSLELNMVEQHLFVVVVYWFSSFIHLSN